MVLGNSSVLVLNKSWLTIDTRSLKQAFKAVVTERAVFLDAEYNQHDMSSWISLPVTEDDKYIGSSFRRIKVPEIMLLNKYNKIPKRVVVFCRRNIWRRDKGRCQYCGCEPVSDDVTMDHILPRSKGGLSTFDNVVLCCTSCNLKKGNSLLSTIGMRLQRMKKLPNEQWTIIYYDKPKRPMWNPLYALRRKTFPVSWKAFLRNFDETLYWEVELEK